MGKEVNELAELVGELAGLVGELAELVGEEMYFLKRQVAALRSDVGMVIVALGTLCSGELVEALRERGEVILKEVELVNKEIG
jgi:hypothetical protein